MGAPVQAIRRRTALNITAVVGAVLLAACGGASAADVVDDKPDPAIREVQEALARMARAGQFSGVVLIEHQGRDVLARSYGFANRERKRRNRLQTRFNLASANKMFTGIAIAQLAQAGKLRFHDPVGAHLPGLPSRIGRVTIAELLTHTGGLGDFFQHPSYERRKPQLTTLRSYLPLITTAPAVAEPGSGFHYSNSGYILLGLVVESVTGESYYAYVDRHILSRAGMAATACLWKSSGGRSIAIGYTRTGRSRRPNTRALPPRGTSAGGCYSTAPDMLRFGRALFDHHLLEPEYTNAVLTPRIGIGPGESYGYGFGIRRGRAGDHATVGHNGGFPGVGTEIAYNPGLEYAVIILSNDDPPAVSAAADTIFNRLKIP